MNIKEYCVICLDPINPDQYEIRGNFCISCTHNCEILSKLFPGENPQDPMIKHKTKKAERKYKTQCKQWNKNLTRYNKACRSFQMKILPTKVTTR